jgi:coenzyme F420-0:L-glutamate ligase/coenzyme F420-1:gamma-L-glutamate ligase
MSDRISIRGAVAAIMLQAIPGLPEVAPGDDLARLIGETLMNCGLLLRDGDILVVAQKVVSKAENCFVDLRSITPGARAHGLAKTTGKDPRLVELILSQSSDVLRVALNLLIVRHRLGYVMANAGIDRSNVKDVDGKDLVLLLPSDPERSAQELRARLMALFGVELSVVISDSFGRPWRNGTVNVALAAAGLPALHDRRGERDRHGRILEATQVAAGDAVAAAAGLAMGEGAEGTPVVLLRGLKLTAPHRDATSLIRPLSEDLFQ